MPPTRRSVVLTTGEREELNAEGHLPWWQPCTTSPSSLRIATWNCRGLQHGKEHICDLLQNSDILILNEHWLQPYGSTSSERFIPDLTCCYLRSTETVPRYEDVVALPSCGKSHFVSHQWKALKVTDFSASELHWPQTQQSNLQ